MDVQRIETEGTRIDRVRNQRRMVLELEAIPVNGCMIETHHVTGKARIEVYADRLPSVLERVRTADHDRIERDARAMADRLIGEDIRKLKLEAEWARCTDAEQKRDLLIKHRINHAWPQLVRLAGGGSGLPPLRSCKVVHVRTGLTMDARAWDRLPDDAKAGWLDAPPPTPENASSVAQQQLADAFTTALQRAGAPKTE